MHCSLCFISQLPLSESRKVPTDVLTDGCCIGGFNPSVANRQIMYMSSITTKNTTETISSPPITIF